MICLWWVQRLLIVRVFFIGFFELLCKNGGHRLLLRLYVLYICCYMTLFAAVVVIYGNKKLSCRWQTARRICANAMAWLISLKHVPSHMYYRAEFGRSALKNVGINTEEPPKLGNAGTPLSWDGRRGWPQDTRNSPTCVSTPNLVVLRQRVYA